MNCALGTTNVTISGMIKKYMLFITINIFIQNYNKKCYKNVTVATINNIIMINLKKIKKQKIRHRKSKKKLFNKFTQSNFLTRSYYLINDRMQGNTSA